METIHHQKSTCTETMSYAVICEMFGSSLICTDYLAMFAVALSGLQAVKGATACAIDLRIVRIAG